MWKFKFATRTSNMPTKRDKANLFTPQFLDKMSPQSFTWSVAVCAIEGRPNATAWYNQEMFSSICLFRNTSIVSDNTHFLTDVQAGSQRRLPTYILVCRGLDSIFSYIVYVLQINYFHIIQWRNSIRRSIRSATQLHLAFILSPIVQVSPKSKCHLILGHNSSNNFSSSVEKRLNNSLLIEINKKLSKSYIVSL